MFLAVAPELFGQQMFFRKRLHTIKANLPRGGDAKP